MLLKEYIYLILSDPSNYGYNNFLSACDIHGYPPIDLMKFTSLKYDLLAAIEVNKEVVCPYVAYTKYKQTPVKVNKPSVQVIHSTTGCGSCGGGSVR